MFINFTTLEQKDIPTMQSKETLEEKQGNRGKASKQAANSANPDKPL